MIGRTISHYEILEQVGDGGMGSVYKALDTKLQVHRALKFIHPHLVADEAFKQRFIQEAQAASSLDHANICAIHEVDETEAGRPFICMTYYEGDTLSKRMPEAPLPVVEVFRIGFSIASGLNCAHQNGIVHRDIKPANILITEDSQIKILDFGLAKLAGAAALTKTGVTLGTVRYMSPEQATGQETDHRSDIWSLGLLMYEMATGEYPFPGDFDPAVIYSILNTEPEPAHEVNPDIPETHSRVIARCLAKDPAKRYQSIPELIHDMGAAARAEGWESTFGEMMLSVSNGGFGVIPARRRTWRRRLMGAALAVVVVAGLIWWVGRPPPLFTTDLRVAVMPLENKTHPSQDNLNAGLGEVVYQMLDEMSRRHDSMWVVPSRLVRYAKIGEDAQAKDSFGVNRLVTGGLQRFEGGEVLNLVLKDADSLEQIRSVHVPFDPEINALADSVQVALADLLDLEAEHLKNTSPFLPIEGKVALRYLQGLGASLDGEQHEVVAIFAEVTEKAPDFGMGWVGLGQAQWREYSRTGDGSLSAQAIKSLVLASERAAGFWRPWFELGEIQRMSGNNQAALDALFTANDLSPDNPRVVGILARVLRYEKRMLEAEELLQGPIVLHPDNFENQRSLGTFYLLTGEEGAALGKYESTLALAPDDAFTLNQIGAIHVGRGEYGTAIRYFERAYSLLPTCLTCSNIGLSLYHEEKFREAASYYELALEHCGEDDAETWANWARSLYWTEGGRADSVAKFERAIEMTRVALNEDPGDLKQLGLLIEFHAMIGDRPATLGLIAAADSLGGNDPGLLYRIGDAYELVGDREAALRYLGEAMRHGVPVERIQNTRELAHLVQDPRFVRMVSAASGTEDSQADSLQ